MPTFTLRTTSQEDHDFMVAKLDGWDAEEECVVEEEKKGWAFAFTFPKGDKRAAKVLAWVERYPGKWSRS